HLERARLRLWHRSCYNHGGRWVARLLRDLEAVAMAALARAAVDRAICLSRRYVLLRQFNEAVRGRLGADPVRRRHGAADPDLAARLRLPHQQDAAHRSAARYAVA